MMPSRLAGLLTALTLSACVLGPEFTSPESPETDRYSSADQTIAADSGQRLIPGAAVPADWWTMFGSNKLDALIAHGLDNSLTVAAARARLREVQENLNSQVGAVLLPNVDAGISSSRQKVSGTAFGGNSSIYTLHNVSVSASYGMDLFGASARYLETLESQVDYERYRLQAARMTLAANLVTAAVQEASLRDQIAATGSIIADSQAQLKMIEQRFALGAVAQSAVLAQRSLLAQARTALPALHKQLQQNRHLLNVLAGDLPSESSLPEFRLDELHLPAGLPLSLPSELVRQRPDILAAESLLHQATANVGLATANLYPRITLTGSYGSESPNIAGLFKPGSTVWDAGAGLVQPLFHGGELRARKRGAEAAYDQAGANYRGVVLNAFRDVADTLLALGMDAQSLQLQQDAESAAQKTLELLRRQYEVGAASYLELLSASQQYQQARIARTQAEAARLADSAALVHALGGGWWNEPAVQKTETQIDAMTENRP